MKKIILLVITIEAATCLGNVLNGNFEYSHNVVLRILNQWMYYDEFDFNQPLMWSCQNNVYVTNEFVPDDNLVGSSENWNTRKIKPFSGDSFIVLSSGHIGNSRQGYFELSKANQRITVSSGQVIEGVYFFGTRDYCRDNINECFDDNCYIKLTPIDSNKQEITLADYSIKKLGQDYSSMYGWEKFEHKFTFQESGVYDLVLCVKNSIDFALASYLMVDSISICKGDIENIEKMDLNCDCRLDLRDFNILANSWFEDCNDKNCALGQDINDDNSINYKDSAVLSENWNYQDKQTLNFIEYARLVKNEPNSSDLLYIISKEWLK